MRLSVIAMDMGKGKIITKFRTEAASIGELLSSGEIARRIDGRAYDSLTVFRLPEAIEGEHDLASVQ